MESTAPITGSTDTQTTASWIKWAVAGFLVAVAIWRWMVAGAPGGGDWSLYMSHARALLEGRPYNDTGYLFSELVWVIGPPTYPPGTSVSIAPLLAVFGESTVAPRILMHALLALFCFAAFRYFARYDRIAAWAAITLLGTSFLLSNTANVVGSDLGLCAFSWAVLFLADPNDRWEGGRALAICLLGLAALSFRVAAAPLVAAVLIWALLRARKAGLAPWLIGAVWGAMFVTILVGFGGGAEVAESVSIEAMGDSGGGTTNPILAVLAWLIERLEPKLLTYRYALTEAFLFPFPWKLANHAYHLTALALSAWGMLSWFRAEWKQFGAIFLVMTVGMLVAAPVWVPRYAWVLLPFLLFGFTRSVSHLETRFVARGNAGTWTVVMALIVSALAVLGDISTPTPPSVADDEWRAAGETLRASDPGVDIRVGSNRPRVFSWFTRFPAAGLPARDLPTFLSEVDRFGLTHVVVTRAPDEELQPGVFDGWFQENPAVFELLAEHGLLEVYRLRPTAFQP